MILDLDDGYGPKCGTYILGHRSSSACIYKTSSKPMQAVPFWATMGYGDQGISPRHVCGAVAQAQALLVHVLLGA